MMEKAETVDLEHNPNKTSFRSHVQTFGRFLSGMVMPSIEAFVAWGLITALFIPDGWYPNEKIATLVDPMAKVLLPLLIAFSGGRMVHGIRGGMVGAVGAMGIIIGTEVPMFLGAMILGPLGGYCVKVYDETVMKKIRPGFEMLADNIGGGIIAGAIAIVGLYVFGPAVEWLTNLLGSAVSAMVAADLTPLTAVFIQPAKVLFLNNAINFGVLAPLGFAQAAETGKSIMFLLETNPGPGLGVLLAYWVFAKGQVRASVPGATVIHFVGGIHEIYFPYVLMRPILLVAVIFGGMAGTLVFSLMGAGAVATPSPGSMLALLMMTPKGLGNFAGVIAGVAVSTVVSFAIAAFFMRRDGSAEDAEDLVKATSSAAVLKGADLRAKALTLPDFAQVKKIYFACDAGVGSSGMGAATLRKLLKKEGIELEVAHCAVDELPEDAKVVVTQNMLTERATGIVPQAFHYPIRNFMQASEYTALIEKFKVK